MVIVKDLLYNLLYNKTVNIKNTNVLNMQSIFHNKINYTRL